ncbi:MAG TPA: YihY/virulence factor BrkB family protein [Longimicrobium sp.]|jgi:membrane protein|uniref:YihY/virulence factor BrkB family protein n=1 Tax=Longimicrobium sp. TaxID=2029185 RepID=UPI002EDA1D02
MAEPTAPPSKAAILRRAARAALSRVLGGWAEFGRRVYIKAGDDDIFFLAGGIAFNVLVAAVPFLLMLIAIFGYVLKAAVNDPQQAAVEYVLSILPPSQRIVTLTRSLVGEVVAGRTRFGILGLVLFIWSSTRLVASLRSVLKHIFDLPEERPIIAGMFFDLQMVLVAGTLFVFNTGITVAVEAAQAYGVRWLGLSAYPEVQSVQRALARILAFCFILLMFVLMYRYLPKRKTPWRIALVAAVFTSVSWELLKGIFAWYVTYVSDWRTTYGTLASLILLVFWIYYSAIVFVLGGEVAQVYDLMRIRRKQRELLE